MPYCSLTDLKEDEGSDQPAASEAAAETMAATILHRLTRHVHHSHDPHTRKQSRADRMNHGDQASSPAQLLEPPRAMLWVPEAIARDSKIHNLVPRIGLEVEGVRHQATTHQAQAQARLLAVRDTKALALAGLRGDSV